MSLRSTILTALVVFSSSLIAQQDIMMLNLPQVMQSSYLNPALGTTKGIHIGLPFMSSVSAQHNNNFLNPNGLFEQVENHIEIQTEEFVSRLGDDNRIGYDMSVDIFSIGMPIGDNYFSFAVREKAGMQLQLSKDLLSFPVVGNGQFEITGGVIDLSDMSVSLDHYVEYGLGWQRKFNDKLSVGARAKLLFGKENVRTNNNSFSWATDPEDYSYTFTGDFSVQTSGLQNQLDSIDGNSLLENGRVVKYILSSKNKGIGVDLGATYALSPKWTFGLSVVDLGFINYKDGNSNYSGVGQDVAFAGLEITEAFISADASFSDSLDAAISDLGDALLESLDLQSSNDSYRVGLRTKTYTTIGYRAVRRKKSTGTANLIVYMDVYNGELSSPQASINYAHTWFDRLTVAASYSILTSDHKNLGLACSFRGAGGVFYLSLDNVLWTNMSTFDTEGSETKTKFSYPSFSQNSAIHFGYNILLAGKNKGAKAQPRLDSN